MKVKEITRIGPRFNPNLLEVPLYISGKSIDQVQQELGLDDVIKLASNENPLGPSPRAIEAARAHLQEAHRYPGGYEMILRQKLGEHFNTGLDERHFVVGNGATDVLRMITQAFVFDGGNTVMSQVTFPMYRIMTIACGGTPRVIEAAPGYRQDLEAMAAHVDDDTRLVYLCSPNNPSGEVITQVEMDSFLASLPEHVVIIMDESYRDYVTDPQRADTLGYVREQRNVFLVHSFSKSAGLANLRVGYCIAPVELSDYVRHAQLPFQVGDITLAAAIASLEDKAYQQGQRQLVVEGREYLFAACRQLGLKCLPSQANFLTIVDPPIDASALAASLMRQGVIVRPMAIFGMPDAIRVSVGLPEENVKFIAALRKALAEEVA